MKFAIRKVVSENGDGSYVGVDKASDFNSFTTDEYLKFFDECFELGILKAKSYDSEKWILVDENMTSTIIFNTINFVLELKRYTIVMLRHSTNRPSTIAKELRQIIWGLKETNFLTEIACEELIEKIRTYSIYEIGKIRRLSRFINFIDSDRYSEYLDILDGLNNNKSARLIRSIPDYDSMLRYDYYINDFYSNGTLALKKVYFPIILWWKFSSVVPMRPLEMAELPKKCIFKDGEDYFIKITRYKERRSIVDDYRTNEGKKKNDEPSRRKQIIKITKEMFELFIEYIEVYQPEEDREYFLDPKFQQKNTRSALADLLNEFNETIIEQHYGQKSVDVDGYKNNDNEIKLPRLGDTRHLAFCSMMLQGFNPLTIMEIGGHENINSHLHYSRHMDTFALSSINQISRAMTELILNGDTHQVSAGISRKNIAKLSHLGDSYYNLPKVNGGRCTSKNVPQTCPPIECIYCEKYFVFDDDKAYLTELQLEKNNEIKTKIDYLKHLYFEVSRKSTMDINEQIKNSANELNTLVKQKALLDTYKRI
ncbi:MAG: site-specific integrase [Clostridia bacterium]|nr:site-specific integrase [Clostridia bacterium]